MENKKAIIVGAGLVGTLWAILLAKRGYQVDVFERRGDIRKAELVGGRSINLAMSHRGWKALRKAGIEDTIRKVAIPMSGRKMHSVEGNLQFQPYGLEDQAIYSVSRGGLNLELMNIADDFSSVRFFFNHKCQGVDTRGTTIRFKDTQSGEVKDLEADIIFGTDGAFSAVRGSLQRTPRFNYSQHYLDYGYKELHIPPTADGGFALDKNALHIWPRGQFMLIALPNLDGSFTCTLFLAYEGKVSFEHLNTDEEILDFFNTYFADAVPLMPDLLEDFRDNPTASLVTVRCEPWTYQERILLMGDASHAIVPFYGQGMNSGFEDCSLLDDLMDEHSDDWPSIFEAFGQRVDDANAIADLALRNFIEMRDLVGDPLFLLRKKMEARFLQKYPEHFLPVYSMVTFSHIPYSQALAESHAQDELFRKILALPNIEQRWEAPEVDAIFQQWLESRQVALNTI
ncbi:MAG: NAD(P)/FAD-dependent oxidoreductase [Bacteroidota bacterium]